MSDAPTARRILLIDGMSNGFADPSDLAADMVSHLNRDWRRSGAPGATLIDAAWVGGVLSLDSVPGEAPLTVDDLRGFLQSRRGRR